MDEAALSRLTERETQILRLAAEGKENKHIGLELGLSDRTVQHHLRNASNKLGFATNSEAVVAYQRYQAIGPFAPAARRSPQLPDWLVLVLDLFVPEVVRGGDNELTAAHRGFIIFTRAIAIAVLLFGTLGIVKEAGALLGRLL